jgi:hypothetical protein
MRVTNMRVTNGIPLGCSLLLLVHCKLRPNTEGCRSNEDPPRWSCSENTQPVATVHTQWPNPDFQTFYDCMEAR